MFIFEKQIKLISTKKKTGTTTPKKSKKKNKNNEGHVVGEVSVTTTYVSLLVPLMQTLISQLFKIML